MYDNNPTTLLNLRRLPGRIDYQGAAYLLNFEVVAIRALVELGYLKPLGSPKGTEHKYLASRTILKLADDEKWLHDASRAVSKYWAEKNGRRKTVRLPHPPAPRPDERLPQPTKRFDAQPPLKSEGGGRLGSKTRTATANEV
jgi:hypothetical protein